MAIKRTKVIFIIVVSIQVFSGCEKLNWGLDPELMNTSWKLTGVEENVNFNDDGSGFIYNLMGITFTWETSDSKLKFTSLYGESIYKYSLSGIAPSRTMVLSADGSTMSYTEIPYPYAP